MKKIFLLLAILYSSVVFAQNPTPVLHEKIGTTYTNINNTTQYICQGVTRNFYPTDAAGLNTLIAGLSGGVVKNARWEYSTFESFKSFTIQ